MREEVQNHAQEERGSRRVPDPLQTPAASAGIREMPLSFMRSLEEEGLLSAETDAPFEEPAAEGVAEVDPSGGDFPEEIPETDGKEGK